MHEVIAFKISCNDRFKLLLAVRTAIFTFISPNLNAFKAKLMATTINSSFLFVFNLVDADSACVVFLFVCCYQFVFGDLSPELLFISQDSLFGRANRALRFRILFNPSLYSFLYSVSKSLCFRSLFGFNFFRFGLLLLGLVFRRHCFYLIQI